MAFRAPALYVLNKVAAALRSQDPQAQPRCLSLSYQDVLASRRTLKEIFGPKLASRLAYRDDSAEILAWHKSRRLAAAVPEWHSLLKLLGLVPTSTDLGRFRGVEEVLDLNLPLPPVRRGRYALVIDNVAHQCFDVAQALTNVAAAVAPGGYSMHLTPLSMLNQGFYSLSPALFHAFYVANGWKVTHHSAFRPFDHSSERYERISRIETSNRMKLPADGFLQIVVAHKETDQPPAMPTLNKFLRCPDSRLPIKERR